MVGFVESGWRPLNVPHVQLVPVPILQVPEPHVRCRGLTRVFIASSRGSSFCQSSAALLAVIVPGVLSVCRARWAGQHSRCQCSRVRVVQHAGRRIGNSASQVALVDTLRSVCASGIRVLNSSVDQDGSEPKWSIEADEGGNQGASFYSRFRIDSIPPGHGRHVGNMLRRTLLRNDLFRSHAVVAFRANHRSFSVQGQNHQLSVGRAEAARHEFSSVPGVKESMIDVVRNMQQLTVVRATEQSRVGPLPLAAEGSYPSDEPESWRWSTRRCGPCTVQARDFDIIDSSAHYEMPMRITDPGHHLCRLTAPAMLELEVQVACCSEVEWDESPVFEKYQRRLRHEGWLMVPPLFSPVLKVNYLVTAADRLDAMGKPLETVQLEVWTKLSGTPSSLTRTAVASLLAALTARSEAEGDSMAQHTSDAGTRQHTSTKKGSDVSDFLAEVGGLEGEVPSRGVAGVG